jgi:nucleoside 2-deoxyribosyltransferase
MSDWLTCCINKGDAPCGTYAEIGVAIVSQIPVYLITNMTKSELPKSLIQLIFASDGELFENIKQYLDFIDKTYSLKRQESK